MTKLSKIKKIIINTGYTPHPNKAQKTVFLVFHAILSFFSGVKIGFFYIYNIKGMSVFDGHFKRR